jgi:hypothetical protein
MMTDDELNHRGNQGGLSQLGFTQQPIAGLNLVRMCEQNIPCSKQNAYCHPSGLVDRD